MQTLTLNRLMPFIQFKNTVRLSFAKFLEESQGNLYLVNVDKDLLWDTYLECFPEGEVRQSFNCNACRQFIKTYGRLVYINSDYELVTFWDLQITDPTYQTVADTLAYLIKSSQIQEVFYTETRKLGTDYNIQLLEDNSTIEWQHFFFELPRSFPVYDVTTKNRLIGQARDSKNVLLRSLQELTLDSIETVLELIAQNNLYRGAEFAKTLESFRDLKLLYNLHEEKSNLFVWSHYQSQCARIRNTAIGTLLIDLSSGVDLEVAVRKYESLVAPTNYRRSTALVTPRMVEQARQKVQDLGLQTCMQRRMATYDDLDINQVLYVNRASQQSLDVFATVQRDLPVNPKQYEHAQSTSVTQLVNEILPANPGADLRVLFESRHKSNLVSLLTGEPGLFRWNNGFSWSYADGLADSIKERVKKAGGTVEGLFRFSLSWFNTDDLDLHLSELFAGGRYIYFGNKRSTKTRGHLDVDMNVNGETREPVENIIYGYESRPVEGLYKLYVNQYTCRENTDVGFQVEVECASHNQNYFFEYDRKVQGKIYVGTFKYSKEKGLILVEEGLPVTSSTQVCSDTIWNLSTNKFHKVQTMIFSPNYWGEETPEDDGVGNKHLFLFLENAQNDGEARGIFNEYLRPDLHEHRKSFELVGGKIPVQKVQNELSGLGFSLTKKDNFVVNVNEQVYKVTI